MFTYLYTYIYKHYTHISYHQHVGSIFMKFYKSITTSFCFQGEVASVFQNSHKYPRCTWLRASGGSISTHPSLQHMKVSELGKGSLQWPWTHLMKICVRICNLEWSGNSNSFTITKGTGFSWIHDFDSLAHKNRHSRGANMGLWLNIHPSYGLAIFAESWSQFFWFFTSHYNTSLLSRAPGPWHAVFEHHLL